MKDGFLQAIDETTLAIQKKMPELYNAFKLSTLHPGNLIYQNGLSTAMDEFSDAMDDAIVIPGKTGLKKAGSSRNATKSEIANAKQGNADAQKALNDPYGILGNWWQKAQDAVADAVTPTSSTKSKASKSGKSLADTLASAFSDKLKANKTEMSNATGEYALWEVTVFFLGFLDVGPHLGRVLGGESPPFVADQFIALVAAILAQDEPCCNFATHIFTSLRVHFDKPARRW